MDRDRVEELVDELIDDRSVEALERLTGSSHERVLAALVDVAGRIIEDDRSEESDDTIVEEIQAHVVKCAQTGPLVDALESKNPSVREFALACLGEIGDMSTAAAMIGRLEDENQGVREAALEHLTLISDQDLGPDPAAWRAWLEGIMAREKDRAREEREELVEKRQRKSKVLADVAADELGDDESGERPARGAREGDDEEPSGDGDTAADD